MNPGIDFVGFRNFYHFRLLRKRNIKKMLQKIEFFDKEKINHAKLLESFQGWQVYAKWANTFKLRKGIVKRIQNPSNKIY